MKESELPSVWHIKPGTKWQKHRRHVHNFLCLCRLVFALKGAIDNTLLLVQAIGWRIMESKCLYQWQSSSVTHVYVSPGSNALTCIVEPVWWERWSLKWKKYINFATCMACLFFVLCRTAFLERSHNPVIALVWSYYIHFLFKLTYHVRAIKLLRVIWWWLIRVINQ